MSRRWPGIFTPIEQTQLRRKYRVDGVGRPKFDVRTGLARPGGFTKGRRRAAGQRGPHQGPVAAARRRAGGRGRRERRRRRAGGPRPRDGRGRAGLRPLVVAGRGRRALGLREAGSAAGRRRRRGALRGARRPAGERRCPSTRRGGSTTWRFTRSMPHRRAPSCGRTRAAAPSSAASHGRPRAWPTNRRDTSLRPSIPSPLPTGPWPRTPRTTARATRVARRSAMRRRRPARQWRGRGACARSTTRAWRWRRPAPPRSNWRPSTRRRPMN